LQEFNTVHQKLQFTLEEETNSRLNFLDITIIRSNDSIQFSIYQKPTATDTIVTAVFCHPNEHKQSAIRFLNHRNTTYLTTPEIKRHEAFVVNHIRPANQYHTPNTSRIQDSRNHNHEPSKNKKWAKIAYVEQDVRSITNLFKHTDIGIAFSTVNSIEKLLSPTHHNPQPEEYTKSGVYALTCNQCKKRYKRSDRPIFLHAL
jgi:hypothetical protein